VISTNLDDGSLTPQSFPEKLRKLKDNYFLNSTPAIWVVQMAWSSGLGEALRRDYVFAEIEPHVFDRYIEVFRLPQHKRVDQVPSR
jgi:hypothetical protein